MISRRSYSSTSRSYESYLSNDTCRYDIDDFIHETLAFPPNMRYHVQYRNPASSFARRRYHVSVRKRMRSVSV